MMLREAFRRAGGLVSVRVILILGAGLILTGCGDSGDSGKIEYSQKFEAPAGVKENPPADPNQPVVSRADRRRREIEESREENTKKPAKGKRGRP